MTESKGKLLDMANLPCRMDCLLIQDIWTKKEDVSKELCEGIGSDCWGVWVMSADQKSLIKQYFTYRVDIPLLNQINKLIREFGNNKEISNALWSVRNVIEKDSNKIRDILMKDCSELITHMEQGNTIVIVYGHSRFMEEYFSMKNGIYIRSQIKHTYTEEGTKYHW